MPQDADPRSYRLRRSCFSRRSPEVDAKEQIAVWRTEIHIDQLLAEQGDAVTSSSENHRVFFCPPGTAKTTFARAVGDVLFGLGEIERPEVKEVCFVACWVALRAVLRRGRRNGNH